MRAELGRRSRFKAGHDLRTRTLNSFQEVARPRPASRLREALAGRMIPGLIASSKPLRPLRVPVGEVAVVVVEDLGRER
jgi:hypothetical protein